MMFNDGTLLELLGKVKGSLREELEVKVEEAVSPRELDVGGVVEKEDFVAPLVIFSS